MFPYRQTRHQVARGTRPDGVKPNDGSMALVKPVSRLHATYQIRLLLFLAVQRKVKLILLVRPETKLSPALAALVREHAKSVRVERAT